MPRKLPELKCHKHSGLAYCRFKKKDFYFGKWGTEESQKRFSRWLKKVIEGEQSPLPPLPAEKECLVNELLLRFLDAHKPPRYSQGEFDNVRSAARVILLDHRLTPASEFGPLALQEVRDRMIDEGWPRDRINSQVCRVRRMFEWAASQEIIPIHNVWALKTVKGLRRGQTRAKECKAVTQARAFQIEAVLDELTPVVRDMVLLQRESGIRPGDVFNMRPCEIDRARGDVWVYRPSRHKMRHKKPVLAYALGPLAIKVLSPYMDDSRSDPTNRQGHRMGLQPDPR